MVRCRHRMRIGPQEHLGRVAEARRHSRRIYASGAEPEPALEFVGRASLPSPCLGRVGSGWDHQLGVIGSAGDEVGHGAGVDVDDAEVEAMAEDAREVGVDVLKAGAGEPAVLA